MKLEYENGTENGSLPVRGDAPEISSDETGEQEKIHEIAFHFKKIMEVLGLDLESSHLKDTPRRVAKMYVQEIFRGLNPENFPKISLFDNDFAYHGMLVERNISLYSFCEHHFVPIIGKVQVAFFPDKKIIGLSKINRLVEFFAQKPQVQERLTKEIGDQLKKILKTEDVAVLIEADHLCVAARGIKDTNSSTRTSYLSGKFQEEHHMQAFLENCR